MEAVVVHVTQMPNEWIIGCGEVTCDEVEARQAEANTKPENANVDDDDVISTWIWIMNEQYR